MQLSLRGETVFGNGSGLTVRETRWRRAAKSHIWARSHLVWDHEAHGDGSELQWACSKGIISH